MIQWQLFSPPGNADCGWLDEIREFRARVLYDHGRRRWFRRSDGRFTDSDRLDQESHHLCVRESGLLAGCVRLLPVSSSEVCLTEQLLGPPKFADMLRGFGVDRAQTIEGGRWVVDSNNRIARLGVLLAAAGVALARALGHDLLCCPVGTGRKQDRVLARVGLAAVPDLPLIPVPHFDDELRVMYVFPSRPAPRLRELMDRMTVELDLPNSPPSVDARHRSLHD